MKAKQNHLLSRLHCKDLMALKTLLSFDPTPKKIYRNWLIDCFNKKLIRLEDQAMVFKDLETFEQLKLTQSLDIQNMSFREFQKITSVEPDLSNNQKEREHIKSLENSGDIEVLLRNKTTTIKVPHTHQAACILGRGTKWCTAAKDNPNTFDHYSERGNLYVITHNGAKIQAHIESEQFMDELDIKLDDDDLKIILELLKPFINESAHRYMYAYYVLKAPSPKCEQAIAQNPKYACLYASHILKAPFQQGEQAIAQNPQYAYHYASDILKAPFPQGEQAIAKSSHYSYDYARHILKAPFPQGEKTISKDPEYAYYYAYYVLKTPFPQAELTIAKDPEYAYHYARHILKTPLPQGEQAIAKYPEYAYHYAYYVLKAPFPQGEKTIAQNPQCAYYYAYYVLKTPFLQAEKTISKSPHYAYYYARDILKAPFPQGEKTIAQNPQYAHLYKEFLKTLT